MSVTVTLLAHLLATRQPASNQLLPAAGEPASRALCGNKESNAALSVPVLKHALHHQSSINTRKECRPPELRLNQKGSARVVSLIINNMSDRVSKHCNLVKGEKS
ncbi:hypothetical protein AAFF_G00078360 [Aldrovandia affinis]|uniref:Uncharacterized protein n=1 Tax=Aldrovandia affinis TaxID=143900 RepID=A0AAD7RY14_9TELE|nr:hypothetical protein AAFF_G00078360 [Aldrovandia affinis]